MPEIADQIPEEGATAEWANDIRDRTLQRYDDVTTRDSENSSPEAGELAFLEDSGVVQVYYNGAWRGLVPPGAVTDYAGPNVPAGWLLCDGSAVSRTTYADLFAAIGTTFGNGDGSTTFNLPDARGRFTMGVATSGTGDDLGETGGSLTHTHSGPSHTHSGPSHSHSNPNTGSGGSHSHSQGNTGNRSVAHSHELGDGPGVTVGGTSADPGRSGLLSRTAAGASENAKEHFHGIPSNTTSSTSHNHTNPNTNSGGSHTHSQGNTGSAGTGQTGAAGTGQTGSAGTPPFLALHKIIKT